jgi:hypothetical protein
MSLTNALATVCAKYGWASGMKWQFLLKQSTTVRITDLPPTRGRNLCQCPPRPPAAPAAASGALLDADARPCTVGMWSNCK